MQGPHDVGGREDLFGPLDRSEAVFTSHWQSRIDALAQVLFAKQIIGVDEFRRFIEALPEDSYANFHYYGKWAASVLQMLLQKRLLDETVVHEQLYGKSESRQKLEFQPGDKVLVKRFDAESLIRRPHLRTPGYIFGVSGVVDSIAGSFHPPDQVSWNRNLEASVATQTLYRVRFCMGNVWSHAENPDDTLDIEIFEEWLVAIDEQHESAKSQTHSISQQHSHSHDHDHDDEPHDHIHDSRAGTEVTALEREYGASETFSLAVEQEALAECLLSQAIKCGIVTAAELLEKERLRDEASDNPVGPQVVARAWMDPEFKKQLLSNATAALKSIGIDPGVTVVVHENLENVHNLVVCTLCSCYPTAILGRPPAWYKSRSYRARAVIEPRKVISELSGLAIGSDVLVRVHDSSADLRYFVLPRRPAGTEGFTRDELAKMVNRDQMIGLL